MLLHIVPPHQEDLLYNFSYKGNQVKLLTFDCDQKRHLHVAQSNKWELLNVQNFLPSCWYPFCKLRYWCSLVLPRRYQWKVFFRQQPDYYFFKWFLIPFWLETSEHCRCPVMPPRIISKVIHAHARKTLSQPPAGQEQLKAVLRIHEWVLILEVIKWERGSLP